MRRPIRILELRSVRGTGGGPEKTILLGTARASRDRFAITVCYLRDARDPVFSVDQRAAALAVDYVELRERHSFDPAIWTQLRAIVRDRQIDIVHAHEYKTNILALLLARTEGVIPLSTVHGWTGHSRRERLLYYPLDKRVLSRFPRILSVSGEILHELLRTGTRPDRVTIILNGIDHRAFRRVASTRAAARAALGLGDDDIVIGSVGRLEPQKRFDLLIDAFAELRRSMPKLRLLIAGDGSLRPQLTAQAARVGDSCTLLGHCTDIPGVYHALDLFVQSSDYEGTPNTVLEAMAFEVPIVATDAGGTAEIVVDRVHGLVVPPRDVPALTTAVRDTIADPAATARRVAAARRRIEHELSFDKRMARVEAVYEQLMGERSERSEGFERFERQRSDRSA